MMSWSACAVAGCSETNAPIFSMSSSPVSGSGARARVKPRNSSGVRTKKTGMVMLTMSVVESSGR